MRINQDKLQKLAQKVHYNAIAHGWHDEKKSDEHWLCMIMTEVAEAVEADRKQKRACRDMFEREIGNLQLENYREKHWVLCFEKFIKDTLEDEFADICIRIFDFAYEKFGDGMRWFSCRVRIYENWSFTDTAYYIVHDILNSGMMNLSELVEFMYEWATMLCIDLDWHIKAKMSYNETRPYKHNKEY